MPSIKTRLVDIFTTPSLQESNGVTNDTIANLVANLPPHFKINGVADASRKIGKESKIEPTFLVVIGVSVLSVGEILKAWHQGNYSQIIIYDNDIYDFDILRIVNNFVNIATYRGLERLGAKDRNEISERLKSIIMVKNGSDLCPTLNALDGQLDASKVVDRKKAIESQNKIEKVADKDNIVKAAAIKGGANSVMKELEGMI